MPITYNRQFANNSKRMQCIHCRSVVDSRFFAKILLHHQVVNRSKPLNYFYSRMGQNSIKLENKLLDFSFNLTRLGAVLNFSSSMKNNFIKCKFLFILFKIKVFPYISWIPTCSLDWKYGKWYGKTFILNKIKRNLLLYNVQRLQFIKCVLKIQR